MSRKKVIAGNMNNRMASLFENIFFILFPLSSNPLLTNVQIKATVYQASLLNSGLHLLITDS